VSARLPRVRERAGAVLFVWALQLLAAALIAAPVAGAFAGTGVAAHPHGDRVLFEPGGVLLIESLRLGAGALLGALRASLLELVVLAVAGIVPLAALLLALATRERLRIGAWLGAAVAHFPAFVLIGGASWLVRAVLVVLSLLAWGALDDGLGSALGERGADLAGLGGLLFAAILLAAVGITADLARAASVRERARALPAIAAGLRSFVSRPLAAAVSWLIPAVWSVAIVAAAALAVGALRLELSGSWRVAAALFAHQAAVLALVALRALWLSKALELVASATPSRLWSDDRSAGSDAPGDPSPDHDA
jgi:hypothetical protein